MYKNLKTFIDRELIWTIYWIILIEFFLSTFNHAVQEKRRNKLILKKVSKMRE